MSYLSQEKSAESVTVNFSHSQSQFATISYDELITPEALYKAYIRARFSKRKKGYIFRFECSLFTHLNNLYTALKNRQYQPIPCRVFMIYCTAGQKMREIHAPSFIDLIAQFVFYDAVYPVFERGFIFDSYGCRKNKGALRAADRVQEFMRKSPAESYYLQIDIRKYYYSIDHAVLRESLSRRITDHEIVDLAMSFCEDGNKGVNVGSLIAQLYGLIYLDRFDHWVKRKLKIKHYVRYVDDMVFIGLSRDEAYILLSIIQNYLESELKLKLSKWKIMPIRKGINFAGYRTWRKSRFIRKRSLKTFSKRLKSEDWEAMESVLAHAEPSSSYSHLITKLLTVDLSNVPLHIQRRINRWLSTHTVKK